MHNEAISIYMNISLCNAWVGYFIKCGLELSVIRAKAQAISYGGHLCSFPI
jgi:hypothetical protein